MQSGVPLEPGEEILKDCHRHWISLLPVLFSSIGLIVVVVLLTSFLSYVNQTIHIEIPPAILSLLVLVLFALAAVILLIGLWIWRHNRLIITNLHVVQINQTGLFSKGVSQLSLSKIQDVSFKQNGFLPTMLGFGDIIVETAGEEENFTFRQLAEPAIEVQRIMKAHEALVHKNPADGIS